MENIKNQFLLNPEITYLNHGSFGACPKPIFENYQYWQKILEESPFNFINKKSENILQASKQALAKYINCNADDFFFLANPTTAINQIIRCLNLKPGDEVLSTNQEYGGIAKTFEYYAEKIGFTFCKQPISLPLTTKEKFVDDFFAGYNKNTKVVSLGQYTSVTALIFPVKEICKRAKELGLITIIDGAHVPGHIPLNIADLDADFYTGTLHKWLLSPKGCSFLYVNKKVQQILKPLIISWGYKSAHPTKSAFLDENEKQGTRDISAYLTMPSIINFFEENNMPKRQDECKKIIREQYPIFCDLLNTKPLCTISPDFLGQMCSIPINTNNYSLLRDTFFNEHQIEIGVMQLGNSNYLRISYQIYNSMDDLEYLKSTLKSIFK